MYSVFFLRNVSHCARFTAEIDVGSIRCGCVLASFTGIRLQQLCSDLGGPALFFMLWSLQTDSLSAGPPTSPTSLTRYQSRKRRVGRRARRIVYCYVAFSGWFRCFTAPKWKKKINEREKTSKNEVQLKSYLLSRRGRKIIFTDLFLSQTNIRQALLRFHY